MTVEIDLRRLEKDYLAMPAEEFSLLRRGDLTPEAAEIYDRVAAIRRAAGDNAALESGPVSSDTGPRDQFADFAIRFLRGSAGLLANTLGAVIGVGFLKSLSSLLVKLLTHSRVSIILTEWIGSIVFARCLASRCNRGGEPVQHDGYGYLVFCGSCLALSCISDSEIHCSPSPV